MTLDRFRLALALVSWALTFAAIAFLCGPGGPST